MVVRLVAGVAKALKSAAMKTLQEALFPDMMTPPEAMRILGVEAGYSKDELETRYRRMYSANSLANKGSPYIQEKIGDAYSLLSGSWAREPGAR